MKQTNRAYSQGGMSMLYVMAALIVTGFIGGAMIKLVTGDQLGNALYSTSATARSAAQSGIIAAVQNLETRSDIVPFLTEWINKSKTGGTVGDEYKWLTSSGTPDYVNLSSDGSTRFRAKMVAFDKEKFNVTIMSEGIGKGGAKAVSTAVYHLDGLAYSSEIDWSDENAIHLEDDVSVWFHAPVTINGNVRLSKNCRFDGFTSGSVFNGKFRSQSSSNDMEFFGSIEFKGNTFFGTCPKFQYRSTASATMSFWKSDGTLATITKPDEAGAALVRENAAFPNGFLLQDGFNTTTQSVKLSCSKTTYWTNKLRYQSSPGDVAKTYSDFGGTGNTLYYNNTVAAKTFETSHSQTVNHPTYVPKNLTEAEMLTSLGMSVNPYKIRLDPTVIPLDSCIYLKASGTFNADSLNDSIAKYVTSKTWKGFYVFRVNANTTVNLTTGSEEIEQKVIVIVSGSNAKLQPGSTGKMFSTKVTKAGNNAQPFPASGHFTIIASNGGQVQNIGGWSSMRGLFYCDQTTFKVGGSENVGISEFYGAFYGRGSSSSIEWYPAGLGSPGTITFDPNVYKELASANIISLVDNNDQPIQDVSRLTLTKSAITADLISQSM